MIVTIRTAKRNEYATEGATTGLVAVNTDHVISITSLPMATVVSETLGEPAEQAVWAELQMVNGATLRAYLGDGADQPGGFAGARYFHTFVALMNGTVPEDTRDLSASRA